MQVKIILNAFQNDFLSQLSECFAFYSQFYSEHSLSLILFSSFEKEIENIKYLSELNKSKIFSEITLLLLSQNTIELQLDALYEYEKKSEVHTCLFPSNLWGKSICTRFAYRIKAISLNNVTSIEADHSQKAYFVKKISYSNNCIVELFFSASSYCLSLAKESFRSVHILQAAENLHKSSNHAQMQIEDIQRLNVLILKHLNGKTIDYNQKYFHLMKRLNQAHLAMQSLLLSVGKG